MAEALVSCLLGLNLVSHYGHLRRSRALRGSPTSCGVWGRLLELYERSNLSRSEKKGHAIIEIIFACTDAIVTGAMYAASVGPVQG